MVLHEGGRAVVLSKHAEVCALSSYHSSSSLSLSIRVLIFPLVSIFFIPASPYFLPSSATQTGSTGSEVIIGWLSRGVERCRATHVNLHTPPLPSPSSLAAQEQERVIEEEGGIQREKVRERKRERGRLGGWESSRH